MSRQSAHLLPSCEVVLSLLRMVRGIPNLTGTACHVGSAVILLAYAFPPIQRGLEAVVHSRGGGAIKGGEGCTVAEALSRLLQDITDEEVGAGDTPGVVDPSALYEACQEQLRLQPNELGDAVTAILKLLKCIEEEAPELQTLLEACLGAGRVHSEIVRMTPENETAEESGQRRIRRRTKTLKSRPMPRPYLVQCCDCDSLEEALLGSLKPSVLNGYRWSENDAAADQEELVAEMSGAFTVVDITTKQVIMESLPPIWMLQLERLSLGSGDFLQAKQQHTLQIPLQLKVHSLLGEASADDDAWESSFDLVGGILHVDNIAEDVEAGHYMTLVRVRTQPQQSSWYLVNDEKVTLVSQQSALRLFGGCYSNEIAHVQCVQEDNDKDAFICGVLLVYHQANLETIVEPLLADLKTVAPVAQDTSGTSSVLPTSLLQRRLRVRWNKGKWYAGTVVSYDSQSGKHTVQYDDGDIRTYRLSKKTIEWED